MAHMLYAGHEIALPDGLKADELAEALKVNYATGGYSWLTVDLLGDEQKRVRVLFGPGIPIAIVSDQLDGHEVDLSNETLEAFLQKARDAGGEGQPGSGRTPDLEG